MKLPLPWPRFEWLSYWIQLHTFLCCSFAYAWTVTENRSIYTVITKNICIVTLMVPFWLQNYLHKWVFCSGEKCHLLPMSLNTILPENVMWLHSIRVTLIYLDMTCHVTLQIKYLPLIFCRCTEMLIQFTSTFVINVFNSLPILLESNSISVMLSHYLPIVNYNNKRLCGVIKEFLAWQQNDTTAASTNF